MYRLIYKSRANRQIDWDLVRELINESDQSNQDAKITGVLLATATHFLQVLEGSFDEVNELFMRIVRFRLRRKPPIWRLGHARRGSF